MARWTLLSFVQMTALLFASTVQAQTGTAPAYIPVQGYLSDDSGVPMDGETTVVFSLYTQAEDGSADDPGNIAFHSEEQQVKVSHGEFTAFLGEAATLDLGAFADQLEGAVFLGIKVGEDPEMQPRLRLGTAPFAAFAQRCGDAATVGGREPSSFASAAHKHAYPLTFGETGDTISVSSGPQVLFETSITCPASGSVVALGNASARWEGSSAPGKCSLNIREQGDPASSFRQTDILFENTALSNTAIPLSIHRVYGCGAGTTVNLVLWGIAGLGPCAFAAPTLTAFFTPG